MCANGMRMLQLGKLGSTYGLRRFGLLKRATLYNIMQRSGHYLFPS
jgi:hypothetical protein